MSERTTRWLYAAAISVLAGTLGISVAPAASAASAALACPPGSELAPGYGCINPSMGDLKKLVYDGKVPRKMNKLSSELDAVGGPGNTPAQKVNGAVLAGTSRTSRVLGKVGKGFILWSAAEFGYAMGGEAASFACGTLGWSIFCDPREDVGDAFVPNVDVLEVVPGWTGPVSWQTPVSGSYKSAICTRGMLPSGVSAGDPAGSVAIGVTCEWQGGGYYSYQVQKWSHTGDPGGTDCFINGNSNQAQRTVSVACAGVVADWLQFTNTAGPSPRYYFPGAVGYPETPDPDPVRHWESRAECKDSNDVTRTVTAQSGPFRESDMSWPAFPSVTCGEGEVQTSGSVWQVGGPADRKVWEIDIPVEIQQAHEEFPQCVGGDCLLTLWSVDANQVRTDCFADSGACEGWLTDPERDTKYQCTYGLPSDPIDVPLSQCYIYGPAFDVKARAAGTPYGDPGTGLVVPGVAEVVPDGGGAPDAEQSGPCFPAGWGVFNPLEWVLQPVKCALVWAFVPDSTVVAASLSTAGTAVMSSAPVGIATAASTGITDIVTTVYATECSGSVLDVDAAYWLWPCEPPIPGWNYAYASISVLVVIGGAVGAFSIVRGALDPR